MLLGGYFFIYAIITFLFATLESFVFNYIKNLPMLINEVSRILKVGGKFTVVQPSEVNDLYYLHVKNDYREGDLRILLKREGFKVDSFSKMFNKKKITFFFCEKRIK